MKKNRFAQNRVIIAQISEREKVDISVAMAMLAKEQGWKNYGEESLAFKRFVNDMPAEKRAAYFAGEDLSCEG